jgi:hypothetical protein
MNRLIMIVVLALGIFAQSVATRGEEKRIVKQPTTVPTSATTKPADAAKPADGTRIPITFTGGHDTDPRDHGRPVTLIAAALGVPDEVFRETFTHVTPASGGREPQPDQVRRNKDALMKGLSPYGVTNDRLDTVSNFYRYNGSRGQIWRNTPATAYAIVKDGVVTVTITDAGAGYTTAPSATIEGMNGVALKVTLTFGPDFKQNGSIKEITLATPAAR